MKPIVLTKDCMLCHGDPKGSLDLVGFKKEGWSPGLHHGAFEVISDLKPIQDVVNKMMIFNFLILFSCITAALLVIYVFLSKNIFKPIQNAKEFLKKISELKAYQMARNSKLLHSKSCQVQSSLMRLMLVVQVKQRILKG